MFKAFLQQGILFKRPKRLCQHKQWPWSVWRPSRLTSIRHEPTRQNMQSYINRQLTEGRALDISATATHLRRDEGNAILTVSIQDTSIWLASSIDSSLMRASSGTVETGWAATHATTLEGDLTIKGKAENMCSLWPGTTHPASIPQGTAKWTLKKAHKNAHKSILSNQGSHPQCQPAEVQTHTMRHKF